jgi:hypothetical protein
MLLILFSLITITHMNFLEEYQQSALTLIDDDYVRCFWIKGFNIFNINGLSRKSDAKEYFFYN